MGSKIKCKVCGGDVLPPRRVYCSSECAYAWKQRRKRVENPRKSPGGALYIQRVCPDCGAEYIGHIRAKRCPDCQAEADRRANAECKQRMAHGRTRRLGSTDICEMCGEPYIVNSGKQRYCKACAEKAVRDNIRRHKRDYNKALYADPEKREQKNSARRIDWQQERVCAVCGKSFMPQTNRQKFCGADCRTINRRNQQKIADAKRSPRKNNREDNHV